jgi:hypothetical protein
MTGNPPALPVDYLSLSERASCCDCPLVAYCWYSDPGALPSLTIRIGAKYFSVR